MRFLKRAAANTLAFDPIGWLRDARRMRRLVGSLGMPPAAAPESTRFAIVVMPWLGTAVPWFSIACGLFLRARGNKIVFIIDDLPFDPKRIRARFVLACIRFVLRPLGHSHEVVRLSDYLSSLPLDDAGRAEVARLAELNGVWSLRGEMLQKGRRRYVEGISRHLGTAYRAVTGALATTRFDVVFVPGGVYGSSGVWTSRARATGARLASYDSGGYGTLMLAANGVACQLQDIPRAFALLKKRISFDDERKAIVETALAEIAQRRAGSDKFTSQIPGSRGLDPRFAGAVLVALNSSWDSAALGLHAVFDNSTDWIVQTVAHLLAHTSVPVVVRQHPAERLEIARTSDDYRSLLNRHFGVHPRLHFIAADEAVNSYELLEQVRAVVVYTSTIGIEAAAAGKVVVTASNSYYSSLGFVWKATDKPGYESDLLSAATGRYQVTDAMREDALCCYYLTQCCNWVFSPFNPEGFDEWSRYHLAELARHDKVRTTVDSLQSNIPVAYLNHLGRLESAERLS